MTAPSYKISVNVVDPTLEIFGSLWMFSGMCSDKFLDTYKSITSLFQSLKGLLYFSANFTKT